MGDFKKFAPRYLHPSGNKYPCKCEHRPDLNKCTWPKCPPRKNEERAALSRAGEGSFVSQAWVDKNCNDLDAPESPDTIP